MAICHDARKGRNVSLAQPSTGQRARQSALPPGVKVLKGLEYGKASSRAMLLDLYLPEKGGKPMPLIIWIHGGAWLGGSKDDPSPALPFTAEGYTVAHVGYRLSPEAKFPAQIHDCKAAVRWLRANAQKYNLDRDKFAAWGASAGGHLVALLGTSGGVADLEGNVNDLKESSRVQAVVDWYGDRDRTVPFNQSELLYAALKKAGVDATLVPVKGAGHGFGGPEAIAPVRAFLERLGAAEPYADRFVWVFGWGLGSDSDVAGMSRVS